MITEVTHYIQKHSKWHVQLSILRELLLTTDLKECIKWGMPTYTIDGKNVVSISAFKNHCGLWFFNGSLIEDKYGLLSNAQEAKTKAMRHYKIHDGDKPKLKKIKAYISEAIQNQKEGRVVKHDKVKKSNLHVEFELDQILKDRLGKSSALKKQFLKLTKIQQKNYSDYIKEAKRESTKLSRIEKIIPLIAEGNNLSYLWRKK